MCSNLAFHHLPSVAIVFENVLLATIKAIAIVAIVVTTILVTIVVVVVVAVVIAFAVKLKNCTCRKE